MHAHAAGLAQGLDVDAVSGHLLNHPLVIRHNYRAADPAPVPNEFVFTAQLGGTIQRQHMPRAEVVLPQSSWLVPSRSRLTPPLWGLCCSIATA